MTSSIRPIAAPPEASRLRRWDLPLQTKIYAVPGWAALIEHLSHSLAATGSTVAVGVAWGAAVLTWRLSEPLRRAGQRALLAAARRALETCQACGSPRRWDEPTTRLPADVATAGGGPARLRLCSTCRLHARDAAEFFRTMIEATEPLPAGAHGSAPKADLTFT